MKQRNTLFASLPVTKVLARAFPKSQSLSNAGEIMDRQKFSKNRKYWSVQYLSWCYLISLVSLLNNFATSWLSFLWFVNCLLQKWFVCSLTSIQNIYFHLINIRSNHDHHTFLVTVNPNYRQTCFRGKITPSAKNSHHCLESSLQDKFQALVGRLPAL